jgi:putative Mg2+ transporter-C (MgtC) family protein
MMLLSLYMADLHALLPGVESVVRVDPSRIASYAIASMGFLGAGAIITGKGSVRGLTTAAGLWLVTGMGLAVGAGFILPAVFTALLSLLSLYCLRRVKSLFHHQAHTRLTLTYHGLGEHLEPVKTLLADHEIVINFIAYERDLAADRSSYRLHLESSEFLPWDRLVSEIAASPGLVAFRWEEGRVT